MKLKRVLYLGYYLKQLDRVKFTLFLNYVQSLTGHSKASIIWDILKSVFVYNISVLEYFQFHFYNLSGIEREQWAGTGHMFEYQLQMNPQTARSILDDKTLFYKYYGSLMIHQVADLKDLKDEPAKINKLLSNPSGKLVFKAKNGKCGAQVVVRACKDFDAHTIVSFMQSSDYALAEEFIRQHSDLNRLSPSGVNTIRIITQINDTGEVIILGCRLRISVDSPVDNMAAGNLAAPIDQKTGEVTGPGVYSDITKIEQEYHPITKVRITGFKIPFWDEAIALVRKAALLYPQNRSIGWDVVITEKGPGLIEGNHDWCKLLWQLPVKKGLKSELIRLRN